MLKNKLSSVVAFLLLTTIFAFGQGNNTNSPYTRFGFGSISDNTSGEQRAMGGVSLGVRSQSSVNSVNPASYTAVDSLSFMFDVGASALFSRFSDNSGKKSTFTANLEYITMQFPIGKFMGFSAGLLPYSFSGYDFFNTEYTIPDLSNPTDTLTVGRSYAGNGDISQVYGGLSVELFNHVSLGVNAYYMFGSSTNSRYITFSDNSQSAIQNNKIKVNDFRFRYGAQFYKTFDKKHDFVLGLIFEPKKHLNATYTQITSSVFSDTITSGDNDFDLPLTFGGGLYYTYDNRLSLGLDYSMQNWKSAEFMGETDTLTNRSKIALGGEYIPNPMGRRFYERIRYRAGVNISDSYYKIDGKTLPKNIGVSVGFGIPLPGAKTLLNTTFEYGKVGGSGLMREDYMRITFNATINEYWFFKRKL